jgi:hypothetical protein
VSALARVAASVDPMLAEHAVAEPDAGEFEALVEDHDRAFVIEAVREGYELHYGRSRAFGGMDDDLRLLAGDALYALGLSRLAELGDLDAVAELADLISLSARAEAEDRSDRVPALWQASAARLRDRAAPGARAADHRLRAPTG